LSNSSTKSSIINIIIEPNFEVGWITRKGDRVENQDFYVVRNKPHDKKPSFWGVFDGHGIFGAKASKDASKLISDCICEQILSSSNLDDVEIKMKDIFTTVNENLVQIAAKSKQEYGTTACVSVLSVQDGLPYLVTVNTGDSRAILSRKGKSIPLSIDHKLSRSDEYNRIISCGGMIANRNGHTLRVIPNSKDYPEAVVIKQQLALNMTRALGHEILGKYGITPEPEIVHTTIEQDDVLIIASDGLWEVMENQEVVDFFL